MRTSLNLAHPEDPMPALSRPLANESLRFNLDEEAFHLRGVPALARDGRTARTLVKDGPVRVTLIALAPGGEIPAHHADGPVTIQPVWGRISIRTDSGERVLEPGDLLSLGGGVQHAVGSQIGGIFVLTVVKPCAAEGAQ
jgi:quercetin dioxygenase-like cupin family protein